MTRMMPIEEAQDAARKKDILIADIEKTNRDWDEYQGVENETNKYNDIRKLVKNKADQIR